MSEATLSASRRVTTTPAVERDGCETSKLQHAGFGRHISLLNRATARSLLVTSSAATLYASDSVG